MTRWIATLLLLAGTGLYVVLHPPVNLALGRGVLAAFPTAFGDWNGAELSFEDAVVDELEADDLLVRRYQRGDDVAWLCVVYHQNRRYGAHDPRVCYESQGYVVDPDRRITLDNGSPAGLLVNRFIAERPRDRRVVYSWWTTRGLSTSDAGTFRDRMALSGVLENRSWGAFVRIESPVRGGNDAAADRVASDFAGRVARALPGVFAAAGAAGGQGQ